MANQLTREEREGRAKGRKISHTVDLTEAEARIIAEGLRTFAMQYQQGIEEGGPPANAQSLVDAWTINRDLCRRIADQLHPASARPYTRHRW